MNKNFRADTYGELKEQFDAETAKPRGKRGFDKIRSISADMNELLDNGKNTAADGVKRLYGSIEKYEKKRNKPAVKILKKSLPAIYCAAILLTVNCVSVGRGEKYFSAVI